MELFSRTHSLPAANPFGPARREMSVAILKDQQLAYSICNCPVPSTQPTSVKAALSQIISPSHSVPWWYEALGMEIALISNLAELIVRSTLNQMSLGCPLFWSCSFSPSDYRMRRRHQTRSGLPRAIHHKKKTKTEDCMASNGMTYCCRVLICNLQSVNLKIYIKTQHPIIKSHQNKKTSPTKPFSSIR